MTSLGSTVPGCSVMSTLAMLMPRSSPHSANSSQTGCSCLQAGHQGAKLAIKNKNGTLNQDIFIGTPQQEMSYKIFTAVPGIKRLLNPVQFLSFIFLIILYIDLLSPTRASQVYHSAHVQNIFAHVWEVMKLTILSSILLAEFPPSYCQ